MKQTIERTDYHNPGSTPITFDQGTSPNDYAERVTVQPGETYKGYKNYRKFYERKGLKVGASPTAGKLREEAIAASSEAAELRADAEAAKLEALEAKRQAEAAKAEAEVAIAEANAAKAQAALLTEQVDDDDDDSPEEGDDDNPLAPVSTEPKKAPRARASKKGKASK